MIVVYGVAISVHEMAAAQSNEFMLWFATDDMVRVEAVRGECHVVDGATDPDPADRQIEVGLTCAERSFL